MASRSQAEKKANFVVQALAGVGLVCLGLGVGLFFMLRPAEQPATPIAEQEDSVVPVPVTVTAPELTLQDVNGAEGSLSHYRGWVVLLNNWATWCPPCKAEMPTLQAFYSDHAGDGFTIVAVEAGDAQADVLPFVQRYGLTFPVWLDPGNAALKAFRNGSLPNSYVIDRDGTVRYAWTGPINRSMLEKYVTPLITQAY